jgi:hypothetical protein
MGLRRKRGPSVYVAQGGVPRTTGDQDEESLLGMEEHSSQVIVYLPEESTDIDLFLVVGGHRRKG